MQDLFKEEVVTGPTPAGKKPAGGKSMNDLFVDEPITEPSPPFAQAPSAGTSSASLGGASTSSGTGPSQETLDRRNSAYALAQPEQQGSEQGFQQPVIPAAEDIRAVVEQANPNQPKTFSANAQYQPPQGQIPSDPRLSKVMGDYETAVKAMVQTPLPTDETRSAQYREDKIFDASQKGYNRELAALVYQGDVLRKRAGNLMERQAAIDPANEQEVAAYEQERQDILAGEQFTKTQMGELVKRYPEYATYLAEIQSKHEEADVERLLSPKAAAVKQTVTAPILRAIHSAETNMVRFVAGLNGDENEFFDRLGREMQRDNELYTASTTPNSMIGPIFEDGKFHGDRAVAGASGAIAQAATLYATGGGGVVGGSAQRALTSGQMFVQSYPDYYEAAKEQGMSDGAALTSAFSNSVMQAASESLFPEKYFPNGVSRSYKEAAIKALQNKSTAGDAIKQMALGVGKEGMKNMSEEVAAYLGEKGVNAVTNQLVGSSLEDDVKAGELVEAGALGMMAGSFLTAVGQVRANPLRAASIDWALKNEAEFVNTLDNSQDIPAEQKQAIKDRLASIKAVRAGIPGVDNLSPDERSAVTDAVEAKNEIKKSGIVIDEAITAVTGDPIEARLAAYNSVIEEIIGKPPVEKDAEGKPVEEEISPAQKKLNDEVKQQLNLTGKAPKAEAAPQPDQPQPAVPEGGVTEGGKTALEPKVDIKALAQKVMADPELLSVTEEDRVAIEENMDAIEQEMASVGEVAPVHASGKWKVFREGEDLVIRDKDGNEPSDATASKVMTDMRKNYNYAQGKTIADLGLEPQNESDNSVYLESENPAEVAAVLAVTEKEIDNEGSFKEQMIAQVIGGGRVQTKSFTGAAGFGAEDVGGKKGERGSRKVDLAEDGKALDMIALEASSLATGDYNANEPYITEEDVVDWVNKYGSVDAFNRKVHNPLYSDLQNRFKALTGFAPTPAAIERAIQQHHEGLQGTTGVQSNPSAQGVSQADAQKLGTEEVRPPDPQADRLAAEVDAARAARDAFVNDFNDRGQGLFAPEDIPTAQQTIDATIDNSKENFDAKVEPLNERVRQAQKALADYVERGADRAQAAAAQTTVFEQGGPSRNQAGRIRVAPLQGDLKERPKVLKELSKGIGRRISYARPSRRGMAGTYSPSGAAIKIRFSGDLDTVAHEVGHALDDDFGLTPLASKSIQSANELDQFSLFGSAPPQGHPDPAAYRANEGMAEFIRAMIVNPEQTKIDAPALSAIYEARVSKDAKKAISDYSEQVRTLAGATGRDVVLNNIQVDPTKSKSEALKNLFTTDGYQMSWVDKLKANWLDPLRAFDKAIKYASDLKGNPPLKPENDPYMLARLQLHINGKTTEVFDTGMINSRNEVLRDVNGDPKNLQWLLSPLNDATPETMEESMKDVMSYMIAERTVELSKKFGREDILTGIGAGLFTDIEVAQKTLDEMGRNPAKLAMVEEGARRYRDMATHVLEYLRDKGRISQEQFSIITETNTYYVALQRVMETAPDEEIEVFKMPSGKIGSVGKPLSSIKGSSRQIQNPYISLLDSMHKSIKEADRNQVMLTFRELLVDPRQMHDGQPIPLSDIGTIGKAGDKNTTTIFVNGVAEHWVFQNDIHAALKGLDHEGWQFPTIAKLPANVLRWTVTHFPKFAINNIARDTGSRLILSTEGSGFKDMVGAKEHWHEVARAGGLNAGYYMRDRVHYYGLMQEAMLEMAKNKKNILLDPKRLAHGWHVYEKMLYRGETFNRVAEYRAAFRNAKNKQGMDTYNAQLYGAFRSADLMDFALAGHHARVVNQVIPFFNPMLQGLRSAYVHGERDPRGMALRIALYGILPSVAVWALAHAGDDGEEYEQLPAYQRDMFYNIKIGPDNWLAIPKPFELGLPGAAVERAMSQASGNENAFDGYAGSVVHSFLPDEAALAGPGKTAVELISNYDFFRNKSIIPPSENKLALILRDTETASRLGQFMQKSFGLDARKADHLIRSQFSYFGGMAIDMSDIGKEEGRNVIDFSDLLPLKGSPAYNSAVATKLIQYSSEMGLTNDKDYKRFSNAAQKYFLAKGAVERDARAKELRDLSEILIEKLEKKGERKVEKALAE